MSFFRFKDADGLQAFASLNMPNTFKFIIGSHNYYMPQILADYLAPAVAEIHLADPTLNFFLISDISDENLYFELFMLLACGKEIEITPDNCHFIELVASKLMNEEIIKAAYDYSNTISPITIENAILRLNQKGSLGIIPTHEINFIAENFWIINPKYLFQIERKYIPFILSHSKLKILNEDWFLLFLLKLINDKGDKFRFVLSYVSFQDLSMQSIKKIFENLDSDQIDDFVLRSVQEKLSIKDKFDLHQSHITANQSEINYVFQKSKNQKDTNEYSFNFDFFKEFHLNVNQQTFDYISSLFENNPSSIPSSSIYNFNNKFNPFEPLTSKPFPDYFSKINSKNQNNKEKNQKENFRKPLIQDDDDLFYNYPVNVHYTGDSEQIPIHFTNINPYSFSSSSSSDNDENNTKESLLGRMTDQVFSASQKIFDQKDDNENEAKKDDSNEENNDNNSFFSSLKKGLISFFTPSNQVEPPNLIPPEQELKNYNPESIFQNKNDEERNRNNTWPFPPPFHNHENRNPNPDANNQIHVPIHDENEVEKVNNINVNNTTTIHETNNTKVKSDDDDSLDGYGGFTKEQY